MQILFLGTGSAWCTPEHACDCEICRKMRERGEERLRTSMLIRGQNTLLIDCGPDLQQQMTRHNMERPDAVLITHEHADHFLGMDDLLAFRRVLPAEAWSLIPVYASEEAWNSIEVRFGYLIGSLIEKRIAIPNEPLEGLTTCVTPFKTYHGPTAAGSVGYAIEDGMGEELIKVVYTSDFLRIDNEPNFLHEPDVLVIQAHWLNEPLNNRPNHMSFQRALDYIRAWRPKKAAYLVHISDSDCVPNDPLNNALKKLEPKSPMVSPTTGAPYPIPLCLTEWQEIVDTIQMDMDLPCPIQVAYDGLLFKL
jgi:phosphoribosyl 1,2-cyclic phosphate phosphodiesterase